jgi:hypothetical protein
VRCVGDRLRGTGLRGPDERYPGRQLAAIFNVPLLGFEGEFTLFCVSGRFSGVPSFSQCKPPPCLFL